MYKGIVDDENKLCHSKTQEREGGISGTGGISGARETAPGLCIFRFCCCRSRCSCSACTVANICNCCAIKSLVFGLTHRFSLHIVVMSEEIGHTAFGESA